LFTSLTYQSITLPQRGTSDADAQAVELWQERLIEKGQAKDFDEAAAWIDDLRRHNPDYYEDRLSGYRKELRDEAVEKYHAIEGGQQTLSNLAAYVTEIVRKGAEG